VRVANQAGADKLTVTITGIQGRLSGNHQLHMCPR
jgi:hypothetical protein